MVLSRDELRQIMEKTGFWCFFRDGHESFHSRNRQLSLDEQLHFRKLKEGHHDPTVLPNDFATRTALMESIDTFLMQEGPAYAHELGPMWRFSGGPSRSFLKDLASSLKQLSLPLWQDASVNKEIENLLKQQQELSRAITVRVNGTGDLRCANQKRFDAIQKKKV